MTSMKCFLLASFVATVTGQSACPGDSNGDNVVNVNDIMDLLEVFGGPSDVFDVVADGVVNVNDVLQIMSLFGTYCEPADDYCPGSPMQLCRSMCPSPEAIRTQNGCAADACLTRSGSCCDLSCESSGGDGSSISGACATLLATARFAIGATVPTCADDGSYTLQQCSGSTGYCWCVAPEDGTEIDGTSTGPGQAQTDCNAVAAPECNGCCPVGAACFAPDPPCCAERPGNCERGSSDCGGQVYTDCGSACPATCGVEGAMFCTSNCVQGYFCDNQQSWEPATQECVASDACVTQAQELPPGVAIGRPFMKSTHPDMKSSIPVTATVEEKTTDWSY